MRTRTLISVETGDQTSIKRFTETCSLLGFPYLFIDHPNEQAEKVFRMIKVNEFTFEEAEYAVAFAKEIARQRMKVTFEGVCFAHGDEQRKQFERDYHQQAEYCIERLDEFLETLREDLLESRQETVRPPGQHKKKKVEDSEDVAA